MRRTESVNLQTPGRYKSEKTLFAIKDCGEKNGRRFIKKDMESYLQITAGIIKMLGLAFRKEILAKSNKCNDSSENERDSRNFWVNRSKKQLSLCQHILMMHKGRPLKMGKIAGLDVKELLITLQTLAYGLDKKKTEQLLFYDLGGGTFGVLYLR